MHLPTHSDATTVSRNITLGPEDRDLLPGILTLQQFAVIEYICGATLASVAMFSLAANALNIYVFVVIGLNDGVTVSFLGLSVSDFVSSFFSTAYGVAIAMSGDEILTRPSHVLDPVVLNFFAGNLGSMAYTVTTLLTLYIAMVRCMCVVKPLHFGHMFTASRSGWVIVACWVFTFGNYIPLFTQMGVQEEFNPSLNRSRFRIWLSPYRENVKDIVYLLTQSICPTITQIVLFICAATMVVAIRKCSQFRQSSSHTSSNEETEPSKINKDIGLKDAAQKGPKLSDKELKVVRQVVLLSLIYMVCNLPQIFVTYFAILIPGFGSNRSIHRYIRLYRNFYHAKTVVEQVNSSINIFVYLRYNSRYGQILRGSIKLQTRT